MASTTAYGLRYLLAADPPALHTATQNLAEDTDAALRAPMAQMYATTTQSIPNNTFTAVNFNAEGFDTHNGHSLTSNNSRWTCPGGWGGYYMVSGLVYMENINGAVCAVINKNGFYVPGTLSRVIVATGNDNGIATGTAVVQLSAGDYLQLFVEQNSGGSRSTYATPPFVSAMSVACLRKA